MTIYKVPAVQESMIGFKLTGRNYARKRNQLLPHRTKRYSQTNCRPLIILAVSPWNHLSR